MVVVSGRLEPEVGALLTQALAAARETLYQRARARDEAAGNPGGVSAETPSHGPAAGRCPGPARGVGPAPRLDPGAPGERYQVVVHVDAQVLADPDQPGQSVLDGGARVSAETSQRLACDASRVVMRHDEDGRLVEIGARTRTIPPRCGERSTIGTEVAASPAAAFASGRGIISATGRTAARQRSRTSRCSAAGITGPCTRRATRSRAVPTGRCDSGGRTADRCPRCRHLRQCRGSPSKLSAWRMNRKVFASTLGRRALGGSGSAWMWAGRSTSCTLWRRERYPHHHRDSLRMVRFLSIDLVGSSWEQRRNRQPKRPWSSCSPER